MTRIKTLAAGALVAALATLPATAPRAEVRSSIGFESTHERGHHAHRHFAPRHRSHRHAPRIFGEPRRHALGSGCGPVTERAYDRFGRLVLLHRTLCFDRFGRAYLLGGPARGHR